ncbi:MAG TPA: protein kinase [Vicinamibacterales bacterium]|nr:protein kinase [Vicinamibacterales bacterium]
MQGTQIGHYRLDALIGRGGMGEVYRGHDTRLNRPVAIKVLSAALAQRERAVERFLREARAASALNHPNIVTIHEAGITPSGGHYIVQEFVEGQTLRALLAHGLTLDSQLDIARQIARALATAHAAGIVHRDIKPENVMVRADGYVKVLDFGLARLSSPEPGEQPTMTDNETTAGTIIGTAAYMSPEQAQGQPVDARSDIFSFGVLLYEIATGRRPFTGSSSFAVLAAIVSQHQVPAARVNAAIPAGLDALVQRMLAKDRPQRPSAAEVEAALAALIAGPVAESAPGVTLARRTTVGREAERAELRAAFTRASAGDSAFLTITGEPGLGKTMLVEDFLAELEVNPLRPVLARGRCSERLAGSEAYLPVLEALDNLLRQKSGESFAELMKSVAPTWYFHVATLTPDASSIEQLKADVRSASQERIKRELAALLQQISQVRPIVLFFDDLHWADVSTIDLLNYLAIRFDALRLLILGTYRPSEMAVSQHAFLGVRADLQTRGVLSEMMLEFLDREDIERYLAIEFPEHDFPLELGDLVHARTEGNPLFMADLLRYLKDRRAITRERGRWKLAGTVADVERDLPESVRSMIARKIERLDDADRRLLVAASVQGHEFDSTVVSEALEMPAEEVEERLERLDHVHFFVKPAGEQEFADRTLTLRYRFVHVLYQNMLYASLQPTRRASLSGRVAASVVAHQGDQSPAGAAQLAILFEGARDFRNAAAQYLEAARHAATLLAFREAVALSRRGLKAVQALPEDPLRVQQELGLQLILGLSLRSIQGWAAPEVEKIYTRARYLCQELGDTPELFPVLWGLTLYHAIRGDLSVFQPLAEQLLAQANETKQQAYLVAAHQMMASVNEFLGNTVASSEHFEQAIALYRPEQHLAFISRFGLDPGMIALALSVRPLWFLGFPDRSLARIQETVTRARALKHPISIVFAVCLAENIHLLRGEAAEATALGNEMIAVCREYGLAQEVEWGRSFQGLALADLGRAEEGVKQLKDSLAVQERISAGLLKPTFLAHLAEALLKAGRFEEGLHAIDAAFEASEQGLERYYVAELHRLRGELLQRIGNTGAAEESFRSAIGFARTQGARSFELRALTGLVRLLHGTDREGDARYALTALYQTFTEGHATRDLQEAAALLNAS